MLQVGEHRPSQVENHPLPGQPDDPVLQVIRPIIDDDHRGESQQAAPVRPESRAHFVDIYTMLGRSRRLNLAVSGEDCSSPSIINALIDRSRESIPLV